MKADIGLEEEDAKTSVVVLNRVVADEMVLYQKLRNFHWNVRGIQFVTLHKLFEDQYKKLEPVVDEVAERVRALGHDSIGSLGQISERSRLDDSRMKNYDSKKLVDILVQDHERMVLLLKADMAVCADRDDKASEDLLLRIQQMHITMAWMLRSILENDKIEALATN